ncbi:efflux RND transporter periplasmic adaptor subunit [Geobacter sp. FeAm09]|uniref:efflux RND transporter periplasmic adaptor subunit n=1 Tax=Geobacter sp. FeAm09 TaxID=2597769 RepID=UPI00143D1E03|nr:efflux RND transporter periplasmic adaptor subunit [Geobacter sp. FeAm09]
MAVTTKRIVLFVVLLSLVAASLLLLRRGHQAPPATAAARQAHEYTCPMHPFVVKDRPGTCPICNMELVPKVAGKGDVRDLNLKEHVYLSPAQQVMANLEVAKVLYKPLFKAIEAAGIINYDQTRQAKVSAWSAGRIEKLHASMVGMRVARGQPVAELFSPELAGAEEEYLTLLLAKGREERAPLLRDGASPLYRARLRLVQLGFGDAQFRELEKTSRPAVRIPVYPPMDGVVTEKNVQEGQYVKAGDPLFSVADLSRVWGELDVYEDEFPFLKPGQQVALSSRSYPSREFIGRITYIYPFLNPKSRTNRVRVAVDNRQLLLKPEMVVNATVQVPLGTGLAVPAEAVVNTGDRNLVWVQVKQGVFVPREVGVGVRYRSDVQILAGLQKDDAVAVNGAFLIDSEAQLKPGGRQIPAGPAVSSPQRGAPPASGKHPAGPGGDMDMGDMDMAPSSPAGTSQDMTQPKRR